MVTFAERMLSRKDIYSKSAAMSRSPLILNRSPTRPTATMRARPTVSITPRPTISRVSRELGRGAVSVGGASALPRGITPVAGASGLTGGGLTGGISTTLGGIGGDLNTAFGGVIEDAKGLIPTAVKIIGVVVILKIVLWLIRGRRR